MFMRMIYDDDLAQAAYLIGCQRTGEAIVIDPERDVDRYIDLAAEHELRLVAVAETHIHADFVSGARELAERTGATVYVSGEGGPDWSTEWLDDKVGGGSYPHRVLTDGDTFKIGNIGFEVIHTPGHTPEHIAYLVTDHGSGATEPIGLCSGDFVFVGDLGRPDLLESAAGQRGAMEPSARQLHHSLARLDTIPDFVQVWPAHGAGSACGKALGAVPMSTIGYERRFNPAILAASDEQGFVDFILAGQPEPPLYFANMKRDNRIGPPVLGRLPAPRRLTPAELGDVDTEAVALVDTRAWDDFRAGHLPGALSFPLLRSFATDTGSMVRDTHDIVLLVEEHDLERAIRALIRIGLDRLVGWATPADLAANAAAGGVRLDTIDEVDVAAARALIDGGRVSVLDVRRATEFAEGHLPEAVNIAHTRLAARMDELPAEGRLLVNCRTGVRSARACAYLHRAGRDVVNLRGGHVAWTESLADAPASSSTPASAGI